ncbi:polyketide cyclase/dehydrase/lipid transport protein [Flavobacteriaceae bacterium MAR_2010_72]|nr:polyketide cyclase/dehydrase/lipid transport protein [Flavobacteriaceae bacterium MAR_2010_72]
MGCYNSVVVSAPSDKVFDTLKNFHDISWSKNVITKLEVIGKKSGHEIGAKRVLNDAFHETLLSFDNENKKFTYSIDDGPGPVSKDNVKGYIGEVSVIPITENDTSLVVWTSRWNSSNGGVAEFCNPIYYALLQDLKSHFS